MPTPTPLSTLKMTSVAGSDAQPAIGHAATVPDTRDEKALPRSESGIKRIKPSDYDIIKLDERLCLNDTNWVFWRVDIIKIFQLCGVEGYVKGILPCPDPNVDPEGAENWSCNDAYTRLILSLNVTQSQKENTLKCNNAHEVWAKLELANKSQTFNTILAYKRNLFHTTAGERDNIIEHLDKLRKYREQVNFVALYDERRKISDDDFNQIIAYSLPPSWDYFTGRYVVARTFINDDPGTVITSQRFIEVIEQEYRRREQWDCEFLTRRPTHIATYVGHQPSCYPKADIANSIGFAAPFPSPFQKTHEECIAGCARDIITILKVVVSSDNLAAVGVGDLDMILASVEATKVKRENTTVIEADKNDSFDFNSSPHMSLRQIGSLFLHDIHH